MEAVGQEDNVRPGRRIDPEGRSGVAEVTVRRGVGRGIPRNLHESGIDIPAEAVPPAPAGRRLGGRHQGNGIGRKNIFVPLPDSAPAEHHPGKDREVVGGREQAGMAGNAAHAEGGWIMNLAAYHLSPPEIRGSDTQPEVPGRFEQRILHAERCEDVLPAIFVQGPAGYPADQIAQDLEVDIAVGECAAGRMHRLLGDDLFQRYFIPGPLGVLIQIGPQPGIVGQEMADGYGGLAVFGKSGPVFDDRILQADPAIFNQLHDGGGGCDNLGQGGDIEDGVGGHLALFRFEGPPAKRPAIHDPLVIADEDDRPGR
ncbi:MAG: hypothetical protein ACD_75C02514G0001, partial [uncultured bacterium]